MLDAYIIDILKQKEEELLRDDRPQLDITIDEPDEREYADKIETTKT